MVSDRSAGEAMEGATSRTVAGALAIGAAVVVTIATFLPWYQWGAGGPRRTAFGPNLYQVGSWRTPTWDSLAPYFVDVGAALLLFAGLLVMLRPRLFVRLTPAVISVGAVVVVVSSVLVRPPVVYSDLFAGLTQIVGASRGPGLVVGLAGASLALAALAILVAGPLGRRWHRRVPSARMPTPLPS